MSDERPEIVIVESNPDIVEVLLSNTEIITVNDAIPGPKGDKGDPGVAGQNGGIAISEVNEVHFQNVAASTWDITYNLNYIPTVTVIDSAGTAVEGEVHYLSNNHIQIKFAVPFSGTVYLS